MRAIETIKNIWKIEDLRNRILSYHFIGYGIPCGYLCGIAGYRSAVLNAVTSPDKRWSYGIVGYVFRRGVFYCFYLCLRYYALYLGIYCNTVIGYALPHFQKLQREGESGRRKLNQYTRYLTVAILLIQGPSYLVNLRVQMAGAFPADFFFIVSSTIILAAGSMFIMWLGERITDKGIGNGISFIILVGIIARLPQALTQEFIMRTATTSGGLVMFLAEIVFLLFVISASILLVQGTRKVPVQYAKRVVGNKQYGGARQYIPLKVNTAGVMPIIFAQAIMFIPITLVGFSTSNATSAFMRSFMTNTGFWYNFVFAFLIIVFTYFYTAITVQPNQMAEDMKRNNGFIPGVKPGKRTAEYLDSIMSRITLPGSIFLAIVAIMPAFAQIIGISAEFSQFFGGTSLLILVGVVLDTLQQIESHLMMRHYDGLLKSGKIKGRSGSIACILKIRSLRLK